MAVNHPESPLTLMVNLNRLRLRADQEFIARLDQEFRERKRLHESALAAAAAKHDSVRQNAELVSERLERERREMQERAEAAAWQAEKERREREMAFEADRLRQEKAKQELAAREREIAEAEQKRLDDAVKAQAAAERQREAEREAEGEAQKAEEARKRAEEEESRNRISGQAGPEPSPVQRTTGQQSQPDGPAPVTGAAISTGVTDTNRTSTADPLHQQYLDLHKRLKQFRKTLLDYAKRNPELKAKTGHTRREIRTRIGQLVEGRGANKIPVRIYSFPYDLTDQANASISVQ